MISSDFFSGWGIRTIAKGEPRYNRMSYHNGSIWPHDNSFIALGLSRYGFRQHVDKIFEAMFGTASFMELRRLPELFCGFRRRRGAGCHWLALEGRIVALLHRRIKRVHIDVDDLANPPFVHRRCGA
jgi:glycogen debranching enzyme